MTDLLTLFALIGAVLTVSALASGLVERAPISFPILFLGLGVILGPRLTGLIQMDAHNPLLEGVATISLAFVLFLDAIKLQPSEFRRGWFVPMLVLGPGTFLTIGGVALAAWALLRTSPLESLLLGAILASTDPVVLRDVLRNPKIPRSVRQTLSIEAGTNDVVVLPLVLILIAVARGTMHGVEDWARFLLQVFIVGPLIGFAVGGAGAWMMAKVDRRMTIRREHQALFGVGLVLVAYAAATAVGGDGFLAAFAAGLAIVVLDLELCDCFSEYGETTVEMAMLLAFVLFGALLSEMVTTVPAIPTLILAVLAVVFIRPIAMGLVLSRAKLSPDARRFIGWFGPRGLASLLLVLLAVQAHLPGAERLMAISGIVVLVSVVLHGVSATPLTQWYVARVAAATLPEERESTAAALLDRDGGNVPLIRPEELSRRLKQADPPLVLDVRTRSELKREPVPGSIHVFPDDVVHWAWTLPAAEKQREIVAFCACTSESTSSRVVRQLEKMGLKASALVGGLLAWQHFERSDRQEQGEPVMQECVHLDQVQDVTPSAEGCEDCLKIGGRWVHLRLCRVCGHVGCCDSSPNKHATKHFHATGHPIIQSFEPGEDWGWCYVEEVMVDLPDRSKKAENS